MRIARGIDQIPNSLPYPVVTLGNFDGVHLGHQSIFRRLCMRAAETGGTAVVFTFEPHPLKILSPRKSPLLLATSSTRERLIESSGIDLLVLAEFTPSFAEMDPAGFVEKVLWERLRPAEVYVGRDYAFGKGRKGSVALLAEIGERLGFTVQKVEPFLVDGQVVSSTRVRDMLTRGEVAEAARLLGRYYSIEGEVIGGAGRGHSLGFPTANISSPNELPPRDGVYAVLVEVGGECLKGAANIGTNPTFGAGPMSYEVHILDFDADLYHRDVRICFVDRIRDEERFDNAEELKKRITADVEEARRILRDIPITACAHRSP